MSKDTVISYGKDIARVMAYLYSPSPSLSMVRSRIGALWRGPIAIDMKTCTLDETRVDFPRTYRVAKVNM